MTIATPLASEVTTTESPDTAATAAPAFDDAAVYESLSPSGSLKYGDTSTAALSPADTVRAGISPTASGSRFGTIT